MKKNNKGTYYKKKLQEWQTLIKIKTKTEYI